MMSHRRLQTLHDVLDILDEVDDDYAIPDELIIFPPADEGNVTDEDSGDENCVTINNLPGKQLATECDISLLQNDEDWSDEDDIPLSQLFRQPPEKKKRQEKDYTWVESDLRVTEDVEDIAFYTCQNNLSPLELFQCFFDDTLFQSIVDFSNNYALQRNGKGDITVAEMKYFFGVLLVSGYQSVSKRRMYWETEEDSHNTLIAKSISRNRFDHIMSYIHCCDNNHLDKADKFSKVRFLFNYLNEKFLAFAPVEINHSLDEAMIPYFGGHPTKQFIRGKPIRWGYKLWVGATPLGYIIWFHPYQGLDTTQKDPTDLGLGATVVCNFVRAIKSRYPDNEYHIFFDNFFSSLDLFNELNKLGVKGTGTFRDNRLKHCPLRGSDKEMKKKNRGHFEFTLCEELNTVICKWNDNSIVTIGSNSIPVNPVVYTKRFSRKERKKIQVEQPRVIALYNQNMGGVDRSDQNIGLYRTHIRGKNGTLP